MAFARVRSGTRCWRLPTVLLLLPTCLVLLLTVACRPEAPPAELERDGQVLRFIAQDPGRFLELDALYENPPVETWSFDDATERSSWGGGEEAEIAEDGLVIHPREGGTLLRRTVDLRAAEVLHLEVQVEGIARGHVGLSWQRPNDADQANPPQRRWISLRGSAGRGEQVKSYRFRLTGQAAWQGQITELRLSVRPAPGERAVLRRVIAEGRRLRPETLDAWRGTPAKVEIDHEVRDAFVALPGTPLEGVLDAEEGAEVRWAYGLEPEAADAVEFTLTATAEQGSPTTLWRHRLDPGKGEAGRWFDVHRSLEEFAGRRVRLTFEARLEEEATLENLTGLPLFAHPAVVEAPSPEPPFNVLLISIDTLRADHLSLYGYGRQTSPALDAWAERSAAVFERTVAAAPWTLPSHVSMLSGLDAVRHGINHDVGGSTAVLGEGRFQMLPEILRSAGYRTAAITGGAYLHPSYGLAHGFERYRSWPDRGRARQELKSGVDRSLEFLAGHRETPFFLFLHTYDVHDPYVARPAFFDRVAPPGMAAVPGEIALSSPAFEAASGFRQVNRFFLRFRGERRDLDASDRPLIAAFYDSGIAHMDAEIGRLLAGLEELGLSERTVVVLTSDHGEDLGEGGRAGHVDLFDPVVLVPLIMSWPERTEGGRRIARQVRSIDIPATLLAGLGLEGTSAMDGVSLLKLLDGDTLATDALADAVPDEAWTYAASSNRGLALRYANHYKLMVNNSVWQGGHEALYDLRKDPQEAHPLEVGEGPREELRRRLERYFAEHAVSLRLDLVHGGSGTLRGELEGAMIRPVGTKSVDLDCPCVEWREMGRAAFEMPPGSRFTLHFEKIFGQRLRLRGALESASGRRRFDHTFQADQLAGAATLWFDGEQWRSGGDPVPEGGTGFHLRWQGEPLEHGEAPSTQDSELRRQLEALGYL